MVVRLFMAHQRSGGTQFFSQFAEAAQIAVIARERTAGIGGGQRLVALADDRIGSDQAEPPVDVGAVLDRRWARRGTMPSIIPLRSAAAICAAASAWLLQSTPARWYLVSSGAFG